MFSEKANLKNLWHVLLMVGILTGALYFSRSTITGNVVVNDIQRVPVNINIDQSQSYVVSLPDKTVLDLHSFSVTGEIQGKGLVKIYLDNGAGIKRLVYSNEKGIIQSSLKANVFTSFKAESAKLSVEKYSNYDYLAPEQVEVSAGNFRDICIETCSFDRNFDSQRYELIVYVEKGTSLKIEEIIYN